MADWFGVCGWRFVGLGQACMGRTRMNFKRGWYTVKWSGDAGSFEERAYFDGSCWFRFTALEPAKVTHIWTGVPGDPGVSCERLSASLERGWYRFSGMYGENFWDGSRWHAVMPCPPPVGDPVKASPPQ